jgi:hypothetical protein
MGIHRMAARVITLLVFEGSSLRQTIILLEPLKQFT